MMPLSWRLRMPVVAKPVPLWAANPFACSSWVVISATSSCSVNSAGPLPRSAGQRRGDGERLRPDPGCTACHDDRHDRHGGHDLLDHVQGHEAGPTPGPRHRPRGRERGAADPQWPGGVSWRRQYGRHAPERSTAPPRPIGEPDPRLVEAFLGGPQAGSGDVVLERYLALKERSVRAVSAAQPADLDSALLAYVGTRKTMLMVVHRFFGEAGCA